MKKMFSTLFAALLLAACGDETAAPAASEEAPAPQGKVLRVAVEIDVPFTVQGANGAILGFDEDLLRAIGKKHGFDISLQPYSRTGMFEALAEGKADITASGIYLNDERKARFETTEPYMDSATVFLTREGGQINGLAAMKGKKISVKSKTVAEGLAKSVLGEDGFKSHPTLWLAYKDLVNGRADAVLGDEASLRHYAKQDAAQKLVIADTVGRPQEHYVFLVRKGDTALRDTLNKGLAEAKADGTYQKLYDKWFAGSLGAEKAE